ncbi:MAG: GxxExxY protein [Spirochaetales bacterium]|nr:GxxExxY protein [Spirochaetales bacterium]
MSKLIYQNLSSKVLNLAFSVHNVLGLGLLEACYEGAMVVELKQAGIPFQRQQVFPLYYKGELVGAYIADLVVDGKIILELKSVQALAPAMVAQTLNYLRLSKIPVGYLMNFNATKLQWQRFVV